MKRKILVVSFVTLATQGCGDRLSEGNVEDILSSSIDGISCVQVDVLANGMKSSDLNQTFDVWMPRGENAQFLERLTSAGLVQREGVQGYSVYYRITQKALPFFRIMKYQKPLGGTSDVLAICGGNEAVESVNNFTLPSEGGSQITKVEFTWKVVPNDNMISEEWASLFPGSATFSNFLPLEFAGDGVAELELTNNGWMVKNVKREGSPLLLDQVD